MRRRPLRLLLLCCAILAALTASGTGFAGKAPQARVPGVVDAAAVCGHVVRPGTVRVTVAVDGEVQRSALVHLPATRGAHLPLLLALHGAYGTGAFMESYSGLSRVADRQGFAVVYPDAVGPRWHISPAEGDGDVQFLDRLLDRLLADGCFDDDRVSVVGVSNGGGMAARFACEADDRLAGLVTVAGSYSTLGRCAARRSLSVMEIHGTADAVVPYRGAPSQAGSDIVGWVRGWATHDACRHATQRNDPSPSVVRLDWTGCRGGATVAHLRLVGGTHAWPGADPPDPGPDLGVSAADQAWDFLRLRRRSAAVR